jgi:signal transduction histidine kinase
VVESLRAVRHSIGNVLELLSEMLGLSRLEAGQTRVSRTTFPIRPALEECLATIRAHARVKQLICVLEDCDAANLEIETDRVKFKQIVSNLLTNALRHTERGEVRIAVKAAPDAVLVHVVDTGEGIASEDHGRIFEAFTRLESTHGEPHEGVGLGLSIARRLAEILGARIELESAPGTGSKFTVRIPR